MKILIGTPLHQSKDYSMERWLENVKKLIRRTPADLFIADNSPGLEYTQKIKVYCAKYGINNYKVRHLNLPPAQEKYERLARSREAIRQEVLSGGYDAWFSWETDQIIPEDALEKLIPLLKKDYVKIVSHNNWTRQIPNIPNYDFGCALIKRGCLEKYSFILEFGSDPEMPSTYEPSEEWFRKQVLRDGGYYLEIRGLIDPILHLDK
jgi:hypothetical protein